MKDDSERLRRIADQLDGLVTEGLHPAAGSLDQLTLRDTLRLINEDDAVIARCVQEVLPEVEEAVALIAEALGSGRRLFYLGAGTSGRLGVLDASECPPTFGSDPEQVTAIIAGGEEALRRSSEGAEDDGKMGWEDLLRAGAGSGDVVVGITASTRTPYVVEGLRRARQEGLGTVYVTCNPKGEAGVRADVTINPVLGPEIIAGSTRMKAGTATKMILNMLTTAAFVRLGKTYGNLMVDIRPVSDKLRARARRILMLACGTGFEEADAALRESGEEVRTALVMLRADLPLRAARALLRESPGVPVRELLDGLGPAFAVGDDGDEIR